MTYFVRLLLLLTPLVFSCTSQVTTLSHSSIFQSGKQSLIAIAPMEDCTLNRGSSRAAALLTESLKKRVEQKGHLALTSAKSSQKQFLVTLQLLQYGTNFSEPSELNISILLKIWDMRADKPQEIYQEMITYTTLLNGPLPKEDELDCSSTAFRVGPLGLAHAKMARELSTRIEDYIRMAM